MISLLVWCVYGSFVGAVAKAIVPGEEKLGFFQTVALGIAGSYCGGAISYLLGMDNAVGPSGVVMGVGGGVVALLTYNKLTQNK
jgi:uncharacterized membrane protein YeaQ/YmgE (transglycosylase-associated protein family)